ncbi:histone-lysine N-methyltransferase SETMAR [Plakobranchus ocellatus]|uniref:Histone-lysine N-methyltransferase SETMAR n=1 Tax=Plakobranchus ocellatus TaxID=259542 RepID=A0AAV4DN56_9GAST|nr:histone-lysine N-methyltransferase SETMAR [Plakobranchus ocellatus]
MQLAELSFNTAKRTKEWLEHYRWDIIPHPAHSPDLAPSDFHLFGHLKHHLRAKKFEDEDELIAPSIDQDFSRATQKTELMSFQRKFFWANWKVGRSVYLHRNL